MVYLYIKCLLYFSKSDKRVVGDLQSMVCQTFKMLHLFFVSYFVLPKSYSVFSSGAVFLTNGAFVFCSVELQNMVVYSERI